MQRADLIDINKQVFNLAALHKPVLFMIFSMIGDDNLRRLRAVNRKLYDVIQVWGLSQQKIYYALSNLPMKTEYEYSEYTYEYKESRSLLNAGGPFFQNSTSFEKHVVGVEIKKRPINHYTLKDVRDRFSKRSVFVFSSLQDAMQAESYVRRRDYAIMQVKLNKPLNIRLTRELEDKGIRFWMTPSNNLGTARIGIFRNMITPERRESRSKLENCWNEALYRSQVHCSQSPLIETQLRYAICDLFKNYFVWHGFFTRHHDKSVQELIDFASYNNVSLQDIYRMLVKYIDQAKMNDTVKKSGKYWEILNFVKNELDKYQELCPGIPTIRAINHS